MPKASYWLTRAKKEGFAVGAFNISNFETAKAVVSTASVLKSPVILEVSQGEAKFLGKKEIRALATALEADYRTPVILNLDHAREINDCLEAIELGFDYIHFDGSEMEYKENVVAAKKISAVAHQKDILVEAEIDKIGGSSAPHHEALEEARKQAVLTDPLSARKFIKETGVDTLAVFIGNVHGLYDQPKRIDLNLLAKIHAEIPEIFLSLHGGSGILASDIQVAIRLGVVKINVNTELRLTYKKELKEAIETSNEVAAYKYLQPVIEKVSEAVKEKIEIFGSEGKL